MVNREYPSKVSRSHVFDDIEPDVIFRMAWYIIASRPKVYLLEYSEAESQNFEGRATFSTESESNGIQVGLRVLGESKSVEITAHGDSDDQLTKYLDVIITSIEMTVKKYQALDDEMKSKVRRALVAKTCWDRIVYSIVEKKPCADIYYQLAHGREMMIKATEGEEVPPLTLNTSGWLSKMESMSQNDTLPSDFAMALAKKSVEWKHETQDLIAKHI